MTLTAKLAKAKRARDQQLKRLYEVVEACTCEWPIQVFRNGHGHSKACPAVPVIRRHKDED